MESKEKRKLICSLMTEVYEGTPLEAFEQFLKTAKTITGNILKNPTEDRFRNIKKSNKALQTRLFVHPKVHDILEALDFAFGDDTYSYYSDSLDILHDFEVILEGFEVRVEAARNNQNVDPEKARERQQALEAELKRKDQALQELQAKVKNDRKDKQEDLRNRPSQTSNANNLTFGARVKTTKDIIPPCGPNK